MDSRAQDSEPGQEVLAEEVNDSLGIPESGTEESSEPMEGEHTDDSGASKKRPSGWERLKQKNRAQERELRELRATVGAMQSRMDQSGQTQQQNPYIEGQQPGNVDEQIHKAVSYALQHREMEERKAHQAAEAAHLEQMYHGLHDHLDNMGDKYDDFDEVVKGRHVPITTHMRDAALFLPQEGPGSAGEVLYKLAKNRPELERISRLHPLEQARELQKLSRSLEFGGSKGAQAPQRTLGNIKTNPVSNNSRAITENTPVGELRKRMKANWK